MSFKTTVLHSFFILIFLQPATTSLLRAEDNLKSDSTKIPTSTQAVLWQDPGDIASRNLLHGPGGNLPPQGPFTFVEEDMDGTSPKFDVLDRNGATWKVKLGPEARPETAATRLLWAVGYFADENYFLAEADVRNMPIKLRRGSEFIREGTTVLNGRWERARTGSNAEPWKWKENPFRGEREFNGLRVMAVLLNHWDLKDTNNVMVQKEDGSGSGSQQVYLLSDVGATFGSTGSRWPANAPRGDLEAYGESRFITNVTPEYVDFQTPTRPLFAKLMMIPLLFPNFQTGWIGREIPREDVRWIADLLSQLSPTQLRDAFRAAGYSPEEVEGFAQVLETRIAALSEL
jgi:hypothetical protein